MEFKKWTWLFKRSVLFIWSLYFSFNWDYNHNGRDEPLSIAGGQNSYVNRWLYGYNLFDIQFEYVTQIWKKYPDVKKIC